MDSILKPTVSKNAPPRNGSPHPSSHNRFSMPPSPPKPYPETNATNALFGLLDSLPTSEVLEKAALKKDSSKKAAVKSPSKSSHKRSTNKKGPDSKAASKEGRSSKSTSTNGLSTTYDKPHSKPRSRSPTPTPKESSGDERTSTPSNSDSEDMSLIHSQIQSQLTIHSPIAPLDVSIQCGQRFLSDSQIEMRVDDEDAQMGYTRVESRKDKRAKRHLSPNSTGCEEPETAAKRHRGGKQRSQKASQKASQQTVPLMDVVTQDPRRNRNKPSKHNKSQSKNQSQRANKSQNQTLNNTNQNKTKQPKERIPALFLEIPASTNKLIVQGLIKQWVQATFTTKAKNILITPVDKDAYESLLNYKNEAYPFTIRPTRNSEKKANNNEQAQNPKPAIVPNLFAVIRNVEHSHSTEDLQTIINCASITRMHSAALNAPTKSIKVGFKTIEDKLNAIKNGIKIAFRKHYVVDYTPKRPLQCLKCYDFNHHAKDCTKEEQVCKKCAGSHKHTDCTSREDQPPKCNNCGEEHPATFAGCPNYQKAKITQVAQKITYAQVASKPMPLIEASTLAHLLSQFMIDAFVSLKSHGGIDKKDIVNTACKAVEMVHKTKIIPETIMPNVIFNA